MRFHLMYLSVAVVVVSLLACSGQEVQTPDAALARIRPAAPGLTPSPYVPVYWQNSLFVIDDISGFDVKRFADGTWVSGGAFQAVNYPQAEWSDQKFFYLANYHQGGGTTIDQYRPNYPTPNYPNPTPVLTYTTPAGQYAPTAITSQQLGNTHYLFVTGIGGGTGWVDEYQRDTNAIIATCNPGYFPVGIAVDPNGNVFVAYNDTNFNGHIEEYVGGLSGCNPMQLPMTFAGRVGGMVFDHAGRLLLCHSWSNVVDVIPPPYTSIFGTFGSGFSHPLHISINLSNTLAFVVDTTAGPADKVDVFQYPSGTLIHTLGSADGLTDPDSAVDWQNYGF